MDDTPDDQTPPLDLRFLKWLVTGLALVMMTGLIVLIWLFVTRFPDPAPALPDSIALPDGTRATAFTRGTGWLAVVTRDDRILIFDVEGERLLQEIAITAE